MSFSQYSIYWPTQFNEHYHMFAATHKATLRLKHKPGDQMQVDWVGDTLSISDPVTSGTMKAYVFVACLPCSMYGYAEAFPNMKTPSWLTGHIHAFELNFYDHCIFTNSGVVY